MYLSVRGHTHGRLRASGVIIWVQGWGLWRPPHLSPSGNDAPLKRASADHVPSSQPGYSSWRGPTLAGAAQETPGLRTGALPSSCASREAGGANSAGGAGSAAATAGTGDTAPVPGDTWWQRRGGVVVAVVVCVAHCGSEAGNGVCVCACKLHRLLGRGARRLSPATHRTTHQGQGWLAPSTSTAAAGRASLRRACLEMQRTSSSPRDDFVAGR